MQQLQIEWRRAKVLELSSQGYSQIEIATNLQIDKLIISRITIIDNKTVSQALALSTITTNT